MKRNILLIALLAFLLGMTWLLISRSQNKSNTSFNFAYREFALEDLSELEKIVVTRRNAQPLIFTREGDHWMINQKYKARKNAMDNMLDVIQNIQIDYVPPNSATENIMKSFLRHGIKVELYDKRDQQLKAYYVGSSPADGMGSYYVMDGYDKPLVMALPSMEGNVHTRFNYTLEQWRDMTVIDLKKDQIEEIEVSYPFNKKFSFRVNAREVVPLHPHQKPIDGKVNKKLIETYLASFTDKQAEYIENKNPRKDSIIAQVPFCEMRITPKKGEVKEMQFFYLTNPEFKDTQIGEMDTYNPIHAERFFIHTNWGDFYLAQQQLFKGILWKYDFFFAE
jgi:hypothetical protein